MKTSVYIPDDLWAQAQAAQPDASASTLLQDCLRSKLERKAPAYAILGTRELDRAEKVRQALQERLVEGYRSGYTVGLEAIGSLPTFDLIWALAREEFDPSAFQNETTTHDYYVADGATLFEFDPWWDDACGAGDSPMYLRDWDGLPAVAREGIVDAMRSAWSVVVEGDARALTEAASDASADAVSAPETPEESSDAAPE